MIIFIPLAGGIAYIILELVPSLINSYKGSAIQNRVIKTVDPSRKIRELENNFKISGTIENKCKLADSYLEVRRYKEAIDLYNSSLEGIYKDDIHILRKLGTAYFLKNDLNNSKMIFERIIELNSEIENYQEHLYFARTMEGLNISNKAEEEYKKVINIHSGLEAHYRYGMFLKSQKRINEALDQFKKIIQVAHTLPSYNKKMDNTWISMAQAELSH